jgi:glycosyltransferase involved in cell wall biosynthesis
VTGPVTLRVALVISAPGWRGSGASFAKVAQGLTERGHDVLLLTGAPRLTERFVEEGLRVRQLPMRDTGPREVWRLLGEFRRHGTQLVMADAPRDLRLSAYASFPLRIPLVYRFNLNHRRARNHLSDRLYFRRVRTLVFQSEFARTLAYRQSPWMRRASACQIPNGYDTARFSPDAEAGRAFRASLGIPPEATVVLTPGKLARNKGHDLAFEALRRLSEARRAPDAYLVLGDGIREQELQALARDLDVPTRFTGFLPPEGVAAALNAADLVVHPSSNEIFPNAVGEAMACGRAVVAMDAGGTPELVGTDGTAGVLIPPREPVAMANAIGSLLADGGRRAALGATARERILREFPLRRMIDGYERAFSELVAVRHRRA